jgi:hypothetical protein
VLEADKTTTSASRLRAAISDAERNPSSAKVAVGGRVKTKPGSANPSSSPECRQPWVAKSMFRWNASHDHGPNDRRELICRWSCCLLMGSGMVARFGESPDGFRQPLSLHFPGAYAQPATITHFTSRSTTRTATLASCSAVFFVGQLLSQRSTYARAKTLTYLLAHSTVDSDGSMVASPPRITRIKRLGSM